MPIPDTQGVPPFAEFDDLKRKINEIVQKYNNLLVNLDTLNVVSLNAKVIEANTITADKMDVSELSAITANLGTITAGLMQAVTIIAANIYGSYIATTQGTYPYAEMNNTSNTFVVHLNANQRVTIRPGVGGVGNPALVFTDLGGALESIIQTYTSFENSMLITCNGDIRFSSGTSRIRFPSWASVQSISDGQSLQTALAGKANSFSGFTGTVYVSSTPGGSPTTAKTFVNGVCTS